MIPLATTDHHNSTYGGGQAVVNFHLPKNDAQVGNLRFPGARRRTLRPDLQRWKRQRSDSGDRHRYRLEEAVFFAATSSPSRRGSRSSAESARRIFQSIVTENTTYPRIGGTLRIPRRELGIPRFLGPVLPAAAAGDALRSFAQLSRFRQPIRHSHFVCSPCTASAMKNISSASPFPSAAGLSISTISKPGESISSTTTTSASPTFLFP